MGSTCILPNHVGLLPMASAGSKLRGRGSFTLFSSLSIPSFFSSSSTSTRLPIYSSFESKPITLFLNRRRPSQSSTTASATSDETEAAAETIVIGEEENPENEILQEEVEEEAKPPRKPIIKLGDIMGILNKRAVEAAEKERPVPDIRTGDVVQIKLEVPENRRRASIYKGIVISKQNAGIHTTIRIRRIIAGIGVEIVFPVYSPNIKELKVVSHRKVRRARLYYLRDKLPRLSTFK